MKTLTLLAACLTLAACSSSGSSTSKLMWSIAAGTASESTGMTTGYTLAASGDVYKWSGAGGNHENSKRVGTISAEEADGFARRLTGTGFWSSTMNAPASQTTFVEMDKIESRHVVQWGAQVPPQALGEWYTAFMAMCGAMEK